jgi:2-dehydro-3-deoxyphosphogluconate aldolase/(4S)-4-hydroxy-2-oxoglutarate aldolase
MKENTFKEIDDHKLVAFIRTSVPEDTEQVVNALVEGGIRAFQIAVSIPQCFKVIENLAKRDSLVVGAGSVHDGEIAQRAINAGARFIVTPFTDKDVIYVCMNSDTMVVQAAATPTEAMSAVKLGVDLVEIYPVDLLGGPAYIKALRGPLPSLKLAASGGITVENAFEYVKLGVTAVVLGSGVIEKSLIRANNWSEIRERARQLTEKIDSLKTVKS